MSLKPVKICLILLIGLLLCSSLFAQEQKKTVISVEVEGNRNISGATILSKVRTKAGRPFSQVVASDDLKRLYALGYFTDIKIDLKDEPDGVVVIFKVEELPILSQVTLAGNRSIRTENLQELVKSKTGEFFNLQQLKQDMRDIQKAYEAKGYPLVDIDYKIRTDKEINEAKITIIIQEKKRIRIKKIHVEGNQAFPDKRILKLMRTRRGTFFSSGVYKEDVLDLDLERIKAFYHQNGYLDVLVSYEKSLGPQEERMYITIRIEEGRQYLLGAISIRGAVLFPEKEIRDRLKMRPGDVFNKDQMRYDLSDVQNFYFEKGYISAEVDADTILDQRTAKINLVYNIKEDELAYINKIKIRGNTKTRDIVIRREMRAYPGEAFDGKNLRRSKERLYNLGFFQEISYDIEPTEEKKKKDLVINVKEAKTGEFAFGAGFSSVEKFIGFVEISQRNFDITNWHTFTGAGQDLRIKAEFGAEYREYDISFTEPWIFGHPLSFGIDLYSKSRERSGTTGYSYDEERRGGDIRLGKEFSEFLRADLMYKLENVKIDNVPEGASQDLQDEEGKNTIATLFLGLTRDSRDNIYNPSHGSVLSLSTELAGGPLGQDKDFYKIIGTADYYKTFLDKLLWEFKVVAAAGEPFDNTDDMPIYERFFAGGTNTIRGFQERDVGPKDVSGEAVGGGSALYGTCELTYPLFKLIKVATFFDYGNVWEKLGDFASGGFKYSIGVGVRVKTPIGPVKLDYAYPLKVAAGEQKEGRFHFSMTRGF